MRTSVFAFAVFGLSMLAPLAAEPVRSSPANDSTRRTAEEAAAPARDAGSPEKPKVREVSDAEEEAASDDDRSFVEAWEDGLGRIETPVGEFRLGGYATFMHKTIHRYNGGESENFFDAIRIVPQFEWQIWDWLDFGMEIEFEGGGAGASFLTENEILIEYAEVHATIMDEFNVQAGLLLVPFGRYNLNHDDIHWDLADRPYVARRVLPSAFDQPGIGIYGALNYIPFLGVNYELDVTQGFDAEFSSSGGSRGARQSFREDNNGNKAFWGRLGLVPDFGLEMLTADFGLAYTYQAIGPDNTQATRGVSVDGAVKLNLMERFRISVTGEWSRLWINRDSSSSVPNGLWGYFVDVLFMFDPFPESWRGEVFGRNPYLGLIVRIEQNDLNDDHVGAGARDDRIGLTLGLSFRPISKLVTRLEFKHQQSENRDDGDETRLVASISIGF